MRTWRIGVLPVLLLLGCVAGCGGSSSSRSSGGAARGASRPPIREYVVHLTGASNRSGTAVIALHDRPLSVCWRFEHLRGFADATTAHIQRGPSGPVFVRLSTAPKLHHRGCVRVGSRGIGQLKNNASAYYVTINSKQYPSGAVSGRL